MKKTGKALSLVLSLALVVSSLATTFASAATAKTEYVPAKTSDTVVYLANGLSGSKSETDISGTGEIPYSIPSGIVTKDHLDVGTMTATDIAYKSGNNVLSLRVDSNSSKIFAKLSSDSAIGTEVVAVRYTGTSYRYTDTTQPIVFSAEIDYTVTVLANNSIVLSGSDTTLAPLDSLNKNSDGALSAYVLKVTRASSGSTAEFKSQKVTAAVDGTANHNFDPTGIAKADVDNGLYFVKTVSSNAPTTTTGASNAINIKLTTPANAEFLNVGSVVSYSVPLKWDSTNGKATLDSANTVSKATTVDNTVAIPANYDIKMWHGSTWALPKTEASSLTETTAATKVTGTNVVAPYNDAINVTGSNIVLAANATMYDGSVGTVTATAAATLTLNKGNVTKIDDADVTLSMSNGSIGTIAKAAAATIDGGTVGSVNAGSVTVDATDEKITTTVGAITAGSVQISSTNAAVKTGNITATATDGTVTAGPAADSNEILIEGSNTTVGTIDADHYAVTIDLKGYTGSIVAPANAESATLTTTTDAKGNKTTATVNGAVAIKTVNVSDGTLTIANSLNVGTVTGAGTLVIPAGGMYVSETMNSVALKLSNANLSKGMTAFTAAPYKLYDGMFRTIGFTLDYDAISSLTTRTSDVFKVKDVNFAGLTIAPATGTSNKVLVNSSATFNVSSYPNGTPLPTGSKIDITFSGSTDNFSYTTTANSITVSAKKYDDLFSSLNKGTITATLVDATTDTPLYQYDPMTYDVQMIAKPETVYTSDTTVDKTIKVGEQYTYKITSSDGSDPKFGFGTNGIANIVKSWKTTSGTTTFYYYTIQGVKEGAAGAFTTADKAKINVVTVKGSVYKSDTSVVTIATGKSYTFKITADKGVSAPVFQVCTFSAKNTVLTKTVKNADGTTSYLYKVTANGSPVGAHGAYVNGVKVATVTVK